MQIRRVGWSCLVLMGSLACAAPPSPMPKAQASAQGILFQAQPGALTATRAGRLLWRKTGPLAHPTRLELLSTPQALLLLSEEFLFNATHVVLSAYAPATGKLLWNTPVLKGYASTGTQIKVRVGQTLILSSTAGEPMLGKLQGISIDTGKVRWTAFQELVGYTDTEALVIDLGRGAEPMNNAGLLPLTRITLATGKMAFFTVKLSNRPNCGPMNYQDSIPNLTFTHQFLYALRKDSCGAFIARVNWHGDAAQTPLVYPDRRNPAAK